MRWQRGGLAFQPNDAKAGIIGPELARKRPGLLVADGEGDMRPEQLCNVSQLVGGRGCAASASRGCRVGCGLSGHVSRRGRQKMDRRGCQDGGRTRIGFISAIPKVQPTLSECRRALVSFFGRCACGVLHLGSDPYLRLSSGQCTSFPPLHTHITTTLKLASAI